jgi:hypothetical protein
MKIFIEPRLWTGLKPRVHDRVANISYEKLWIKIRTHNGGIFTYHIDEIKNMRTDW